MALATEVKGLELQFFNTHEISKTMLNQKQQVAEKYKQYNLLNCSIDGISGLCLQGQKSSWHKDVQSDIFETE